MTSHSKVKDQIFNGNANSSINFFLFASFLLMGSIQQVESSSFGANCRPHSNIHKSLALRTKVAIIPRMEPFARYQHFLGTLCKTICNDRTLLFSAWKIVASFYSIKFIKFVTRIWTGPCFESWQINKMLQENCTQQLRQKILRYEIKVIEQCTDSLFTQGGSQHERYLPWQLGETLKPFLKKHEYQYRWIGNDPSAHIYAYFYVVMVGCGGDSRRMLELKLVLYDLGQKYLAQYEQKLLIQFLCLVEYSQDRCHFIRKYSKIESILLRIFLEIENRNLKTISQPPLDPNLIFSGFSKLTTNITSPSRPQDEKIVNPILRNSNYNNSSMKRVERQYQEAVASKQRRPSNTSKMRYINWYEVYNEIFYFVKMEVLADRHVLVRIDLGKEVSEEEFIITSEKGCFFVVELRGVNSDMGRLMKSTNNRTVSQAEESHLYLNKLLQKEKQESRLMASFMKKSSKSRTNSNQINTPKFISNRRNTLLSNKGFCQDTLNKARRVNIEVLEISQFDQSKGDAPQNSERSIHEHPRPHQMRNKINRLQNLGIITTTIQPYAVQEVRSQGYLPAKMKERAIKTEQNISTGHMDKKIKGKVGYTHSRNPESKYSVSMNPVSRNMNGQEKQQQSSKTIDQNISSGTGTPKGNGQALVKGYRNILEKQFKKLYPARITSISSNETMLSADMLRMSYKHMYNSRKLNQKHLAAKVRPFYSNSPPHGLPQGKSKFYSPVHFSVPGEGAGKKAKINFTYI